MLITWMAITTTTLRADVDNDPPALKLVEPPARAAAQATPPKPAEPPIITLEPDTPAPAVSRSQATPPPPPRPFTLDDKDLLWLIAGVGAGLLLVGLTIRLARVPRRVITPATPPTSASGVTPRFCIQCGQPLVARAKFCAYCGTAVPH